jgi:cupin fold WbuC family metalloprotein
MSELPNIKKILILGHSGFVGNRLMEFFKERYPDLDVIGKSSREIDLTDIQETFGLKDYFDLNTIVIMCSGIKSDYGNDLDTCAKNIKMAENICKVLSEHPVKKFLFFSSIAVYGVNIHNTSVTEKTSAKIDTYYGVSKFVSERLFSLQFSLLKESSLIILRTPIIYGPNEKITAQTPSGFLTTYLDGGEVTLWGDGSELREFLFIEDAVKIVDLLASSDFAGIINPSSGEGHSYKEALDIISKLLGKKLTIHSRERTKDKVDKVYDTSFFKSWFPKFSFTSLENGLQFILDSNAAQRTTCNLCHKKTVKTCIDLGKQPVCNRFLQDASEEEQTFPLSFGQCQSCGLAQLSAKMPSKELIPKYDWITYAEPEEHLDSLATRIKTLPGLTAKSKILGVSFKDESLVKRMSNLGFPNTRTLNIKRDLGVEDSRAGVETVQSALTSKKAKEFLEKEGHFDLIIVRHILEHAYDITDFMNALKELLNPKGYLIIEVPDCTKAMDKKNYAIIWEEHLSYFTPMTFKSAFQKFGFKLIHFENVPYVLENSLIGIGRKSAKIGKILLQDNQLKKEKERINNFAANFKIRQNLLQDYLAEFKQSREKIALLGAGHLACSFINFLNISNYIECVIDDNPDKKGLFMPGSKLPIYDSKALLEKKIKLCLLSLNPSNENKVIGRNKDFVKHGGKFFSIFTESENALPLLGERSRIEQVSSEVFIAKDKVIKINKNDIDFIKNKALSSKKKRARICFHQDINDTIHEMIITAVRGGYIRPHKHMNKSESFHMIEGEMDVLVFDNNGKIREIIEMGGYSSNKKFYYRLSEDAYHMVIVRTEYAVFHEITNGPFNKEETFFAPWSPEEDDKKRIAKFISSINEFKRKH